jgi:hypothetical protein
MVVPVEPMAKSRLSIHEIPHIKRLQNIDHYIYGSYNSQNICVKMIEFSPILKTSFRKKRDFLE